MQAKFHSLSSSDRWLAVIKSRIAVCRDGSLSMKRSHYEINSAGINAWFARPRVRAVRCRNTWPAYSYRRQRFLHNFFNGVGNCLQFFRRIHKSISILRTNSEFDKLKIIFKKSINLDIYIFRMNNLFSDHFNLETTLLKTISFSCLIIKINVNKIIFFFFFNETCMYYNIKLIRK